MNKVLWLMVLGAALAACQPAESVSPDVLNRSASSSEVETALVDAGSLRIAEFREDGENLTRYFEDYRFTFSANGTVVATSADDTAEGTYSVFRDDGRTELEMDFPDVREFYELDDDWYFEAKSDSRIEFTDFLGTLIFAKD